MANRHLRVYYGPEAEQQAAEAEESHTVPFTQRVNVPLREVLDTLVEAVLRRRGWVQDFEDDEITITTDLYEVILAYQHYQRPSA